MQGLRAFFRDHRRLAFALAALALAMKALLPAGFMVAQQARVLSVAICTDASGGKAVTRQIAVPMAHQNAGGVPDHAKGQGQGSCAFSALAMASLAGADTVLLAAALAFILALGFLPLAQRPWRRAQRLRPPLRGPPAFG